MSDAAPPESEPEAVTDTEDLPCSNCGYNLRGLPGTIRRCPECFHESTVGALRVTARIRTLSRLERIERNLRAAGTLCALPVGLSVLVALIYVIEPDDFRCVRKPFGVTASVTWLVGFSLFAGKCHGIPGWLMALVKYHCWVAPAMTLNTILFSLGVFLSGLLPGLVNASGMLVLTGGAATLWLLVYFRPMRWLSRFGDEAVAPLAQELAKRPPKRHEA